MVVLNAKFHALTRNVTSLPNELDAWIKHVQADQLLEKNFSQIRVIDRFLRMMCEKCHAETDSLNPDNVPEFLDASLQAAGHIVKIQRIWDFFRDRLETRFIPYFRAPLLMVDLVSQDCYSAIIDQAEILGIVPAREFREYPVSGLSAVYSPATWQRNARPAALQSHRLPLPVIDLPWDHITNPWELLTIAHEVGHDIDHDLGDLTAHLQQNIRIYLEQPPTSQRVEYWVSWTSEILADVVGVLLAGPAFVHVLIGLLALPHSYMLCTDQLKRYPPNYLRGLINTSLLRRLNMPGDAETIEMHWNDLYGDLRDKVAPYIPEIEPVLTAMLDTPLEPLVDTDGHRYRLKDLISFTSEDKDVIQDCIDELMVAQEIPWRVSIRHLISAAKLASLRLIVQGDDDQLPALAELTQNTVIDLAPPGKLLDPLTPGAQQQISDLACSALQAPLSDYGLSTLEGVVL